MRGILSVSSGIVVGALVFTVLLGDNGVGEPYVPVSAVTDRAAPSAPGQSADPDPGTRDTTVTLEAVAAIADPASRREAALALLENFGHDAAGIEAVAAALPPIEAVNFRISAIVDLAASDVQDAFAATMAMSDPEQRRLTLERLAPLLAETDPIEAMANLDGLASPDLQETFAAALLDAWAVIDPARVFDYLEAAETSHVPATEVALDALAASNPERLLAMADDMRRDLAGIATAAALAVMIERDPEAAVSRIAVLPRGGSRSQLERAAAEGYGERNPEAAWQWATDSRADPSVRSGVLAGIQKVDPDMAWDLMRGQLTSSDARDRGEAREYLLNYVNAVVNSASTADIVMGLDRLLGLNDPFVDSEMQTNVQLWTTRDPEGALEWTLRNIDRFDATRLLTNLSSGLAQSNTELARETVFRLDEGQRTSWAAGVGRALAANDPNAARAWANEFPSGPLRDAGLIEVIRGEAHAGTVDRQLFAQLSADGARAEAAGAAARRFACDGRADVAREIAAAYIADPRRLEETERMIQESAGRGSAINPFLCREGR